MSNIMAAYNPDVLSCLANLSNDEVFTPPEIANKMLDMLPQELFKSPDTKFLDPACKSGVFLREIAKRLLEGLMPGYKDWLERIDDKKRENEELDDEEKEFLEQLQATVDHIFKEQLYGIAITELTSLLARRSLYCSKYPNSDYSVTKFDNPSGNIRFVNKQHRFKDGKCVFCGANAEQYDRDEGLESHAYELIHTLKPEEIFNMKFDVIVSNPPYQTYTNTQERVAAKQARPIFNLFVESAKKLKPRYMTMIIPARWYSGGIGLSEFREKMIHDRHIVKMVDYPNSKDCFNGVDIAGGVCYFLWDRENEKKCEFTNIIGNTTSTLERNLDEFGDFVIRSNASMSIIHKVIEKTNDMLDKQVYSLDPFGFPTSARGSEYACDGDVSLIHSQGVGYVHKSSITKNKDLIDKWKVIIARVVPGNGEVGVDPEKGYRATTNPRILSPNEINTFSYMLLGAFDTEQEAINFKKYMMCKFPRFLLRLTYSSMNIAKSNFMFVPKVDFKKEWTDKMLYDKFGISNEEQELIEKTIRLFDNGGDDNG